MKTINGSTDPRYRVAQEWCGQPQPMYVARFCGSWLGCRKYEADAWQLVVTHKSTVEGEYHAR